ncbi:hypothetical protein JHK82_024844 [Glycine max]|nr:hypothetical protein JHK86_024957 [Glycine max]KAG5133656.1 hypothetical protein JHK82_024844 [Glycine max]
MLEPWLQSKGLNDANQVMAYFAVTKLGEAPIDGNLQQVFVASKRLHFLH